MWGTGGWVTMPKEFGRDAKDLSPDEADHSKKSLYVIKFDDQQRDWNAPPKYFGVYWSADGPGPVNKLAVSLWARFLGDNEEDSRDSEMNLDGADTEEGECYSGFACFGYGCISISLDVEQVIADEPQQVLRLYKKGLLKRALKLCRISLDGLDELIAQLSKSPWERDKDCHARIHLMIGGPVPKEIPREPPSKKQKTRE